MVKNIDYKELNEAFLNAFRSYDDLTRMVKLELNQNLPEIVSNSLSLKTVVFQLIEYFESRGELDNLIKGACRDNPKNIKLKQVCSKKGLSTNTPVHFLRKRPLYPGLGISHYSGGFGTLSCFVREKGQSELLILSVIHVLAPPNIANIGDPIVQPGAFYGGGVEQDTVASLKNFILPQANTHNNLDVAIATLQDVEINPTTLPGFGKLKGIYSGNLTELLGKKVIKVGAKSGITNGIIIGINKEVEIAGYGNNNTVKFENVIQVKGLDRNPFSETGDSGAIIVDLEGYAIAILFAGSVSTKEYVSQAYGIPISAIFDALNLELVIDIESSQNIINKK